MFFEHAVKIRNGIDVDERTNLLDGVRGGLQKRISVIHFLFVKIIGNGFSHCFFKRAADIFLAVRKKRNDCLLGYGKVFGGRQEREHSAEPRRKRRYRDEILLQKRINQIRANCAFANFIREISLIEIGEHKRLEKRFQFVDLFSRKLCLFYKSVL